MASNVCETKMAVFTGRIEPFSFFALPLELREPCYMHMIILEGNSYIRINTREGAQNPWFYGSSIPLTMEKVSRLFTAEVKKVLKRHAGFRLYNWCDRPWLRRAVFRENNKLEKMRNLYLDKINVSLFLQGLDR